MKKITLVFTTTAGNLKDSFPVDEHLYAVKHNVMKRMELDPAKAGEFVVTLDGKTLDQGETLEQLGLCDGAVLTLERREVKVKLIFATEAGP